MFIQVKELEIAKDHVESYCERWTNRKSEIDGLEKIEVLREDAASKDVQRVRIQLYWKSKEKFKAWQVHPDHIAGHKNQGERPEWIVRSKTSRFVLC